MTICITITTIIMQVGIKAKMGVAYFQGGVNEKLEL